MQTQDGNPAFRGAWRLVSIANELAALDITDVAGLRWDGAGVVVHLRSREDVDRYADTFRVEPGEFGEPFNEGGRRLYERRIDGGKAYCGVAVTAQCPECQQSKHGNCDTRALDPLDDTVVTCACYTAAHPTWRVGPVVVTS